MLMFVLIIYNFKRSFLIIVLLLRFIAIEEEWFNRNEVPTRPTENTWSSQERIGLRIVLSRTKGVASGRFKQLSRGLTACASRHGW